MGTKDIATKDYMGEPHVFADAFNYLLYGGRQVIDPKKLHPRDTTVIGVPYGTDGTEAPVQRYRDGLKCLTAMEDDSAAYLLLGIENQSEIHYAMPVKDMVYDALQYAAQVEKAAQSHREAAKQKKEKRPDRGEYLTGFYKKDKLLPVITLVVFFGAEEWDGPMCLHEMLSVQDKGILSFVQDYRINLISPAGMSEAEADRFNTNLREVMLYIKYSNDKEKLKDVISSDVKFRAVERKAVRVINAVTKSRMEFDEGKEEEIDMCQAIKEMREDERKIGMELGMKKGREEGREEGREKGILLSLGNLMESMGMPAEQAMDILKVPESDRAEYAAKLSM